MDIATLLESHRRYMLEAVANIETDHMDDEYVASAHDRATTKTLLDLYRSGQTGNGEVKPLGQAALTAPVPTRGVKAGSKAARQRAIKAGETRRNNRAKAQVAAGNPTLTGTANESALSPATHLAPRTTEGGAA